MPEAAAARARARASRYSPAAELSAVHGGHEDLHVLGYELDVADPDLLATLEDFRGDRARRIEAMADRLRELGFELDDAPLRARRDAGKPIGRPHLADAVLAHPANAQRLRDEGIARQERAVPALPRPGREGLRRAQPRRPSREAIEVIHAAGGVAVWAHPFWDVDAAEEALATLDEFAAAGLDGVECFYVTHTEEQTRLLHDHARASAACSRPARRTSTGPNTIDFPGFAPSMFTV